MILKLQAQRNCPKLVFFNESLFLFTLIRIFAIAIDEFWTCLVRAQFWGTNIRPKDDFISIHSTKAEELLC